MNGNETRLARAEVPSARGQGFDRAPVDALRAEVAEQVRLRSRAAQAAGTPWAAEERRQQAGLILDELLGARAADRIVGGLAPAPAHVELQIAQGVTDDMYGLGGFQQFMDDPLIENIEANGADVVFLEYAGGRRVQVDAPVAASDEALITLVRTIAARASFQERRFDHSQPEVSVRLSDGSRLHALMAVTKRPCVVIRKHRIGFCTLAELEAAGSAPAAPGPLRNDLDGESAARSVQSPLHQFLAAAVRARMNIVVCGGMNAGKTSMLRALAAEIPPAERLITIEDAYELGLDEQVIQHPNVVAIQSREKNVEDAGEFSVSASIRSALRMNGSRVILGEVRGAEVIGMLNVISQGSDGSMSTLHASSSLIAFDKLAAYAVQAPERLSREAANMLIACAVHLVVHVVRTDDGRRFVSSIREVIEADGSQVRSNEVWTPGPEGRAQPAGTMTVPRMERLVAAGFDHTLMTRAGWSR